MEFSCYDYDGIFYVFGYADATFSDEYDSITRAEMTIDGEYTFSSDIKDIPATDSNSNNDRVVFNINTGSTKFASGEHTLAFRFYSGDSQIGDELIANNIICHADLDTPAAEYDSTNNRILVERSETGTSSKPVRYFVEIKRTNRNLVNTDYSEKVKDYWYDVVMKGLEGGKYNEAIPHTGLLGDRNGGGSGNKESASLMSTEVNADGEEVFDGYSGIIDFSTQEEKWFKFVPNKTATYIMYTTGEVDANIRIFDSTKTEIGNDDDSGLEMNCSIVMDLVAGNAYYMCLSYYSYVTAPCTFYVKEIEPTTMDEDSVAAITIGESGTACFYFTPSESGWYSLYTLGKERTGLHLYGGGKDDWIDGGEFITNAHLQTELSAGVRYRIDIYADTLNANINFAISPKRDVVDMEPKLRYNSSFGESGDFIVYVCFDTDDVMSAYHDICMEHLKDSLERMKTIIKSKVEINIVDGGVSELYKNNGVSVDFNTSCDNYLEHGVDNEYNMIVRFGYRDTIQFDVGEAQSGGWTTWNFYQSQQGTALSYATIAIDSSINNETLSHVIHEEVYQSLGIGNDVYKYEESIHWDPEYTNPDSYGELDTDIFEMLYDKCVNGYTAFDCINNLDTPCLLYKEYEDFDSSSGWYKFDLNDVVGKTRLLPGTYTARVWCAKKGTKDGVVAGTAVDGWDDSPYSLSRTITFTVTGNGGRPPFFEWDTEKVQGEEMGEVLNVSYPYVQVSGITAVEWNRLTENINLVRVYKGMSEFNFTTVRGISTGYDFKTSTPFTADIYNEAVTAINGIDGYTAWMAEIPSNYPFSAELLNNLRNEINSIQ